MMKTERVMVVVNNDYGYWEYGVSSWLPWNTAQAVARRTAEAMLTYGSMGLGTWQAWHRRIGTWNVRERGRPFGGEYFPRLWSGVLSNMDSAGNNRALNHERCRFVFVTTDGTDALMPQYWEASDDVIREEFGGVPDGHGV